MESVDLVHDLIYDTENLQLAENTDIEESVISSGQEKRALLKKTKIVKQTWSIFEIYDKIQTKKLILDPTYQRNIVWKMDKKVSFIESLYMGIIIPPIYVVEIPGENLLKGASYEVVDGKQRLSTIMEFIQNKFVLTPKYLEYYQDCFSNKKFSEIQVSYSEATNAMLSSVLDIYVITANSPEFTKYDIFSRLNKGSEPLKVNEIRKAIYQSGALKSIDLYVQSHSNSSAYRAVFTDNDIKRYEDYGRFFRSIAFYVRYNDKTKVVENYNSRPRDMINTVLAEIQSGNISLSPDIINCITEQTMQLSLFFSSEQSKDYLVDASIYFALKYPKSFSKIQNSIISDKIIQDTLLKSASTTSNVNERFARISKLVHGVSND